MVAVYRREFTKIVAVRAHCTLPWQRLLHDKHVLGAPLADGGLPITNMRPFVCEETLNLSTEAGSTDVDVKDEAGDDDDMGVDPSDKSR